MSLNKTILALALGLLLTATIHTPAQADVPTNWGTTNIQKQKIEVFGHVTWRLVDREMGVVCYANAPSPGEAVKWSCATAGLFNSPKR